MFSGGTLWSLMMGGGEVGIVGGLEDFPNINRRGGNGIVGGVAKFSKY